MYHKRKKKEKVITCDIVFKLGINKAFLMQVLPLANDCEGCLVRNTFGCYPSPNFHVYK